MTRLVQILTHIYLCEDNKYTIASFIGSELDELIREQDYDCVMCDGVKGQHTGTCIVGKLLICRRNMVPMVI